MGLGRVSKLFFQEKIAPSDRVSLWSALLSPLSLCYRIIVACASRRYPGYYRDRWLPKPVISVGNITCGGTGKTPFVVYVCDLLKSHERVPAVLLRGYGQDEVRLLEDAVGKGFVVTGANRYAAGMRFLKEHGADVFVLDDGYQHKHLGRNVNIVLVNALNPFGNGLVLPAGTLREPVTALRRADAIIITHANTLSREERDRLYYRIKKICRRAKSIAPPIAEAMHEPDVIYEPTSNGLMSVSQLKGCSVIAFCGLGFSEGFRRTLEDLGANIVKFFSFADHEQYTEEFLKSMTELQATYPDAMCITTEKDYARNKELFATRYYTAVLKIKMKIIQGEEKIHEVICRSVVR